MADTESCPRCAQVVGDYFGMLARSLNAELLDPGREIRADLLAAWFHEQGHDDHRLQREICDVVTQRRGKGLPPEVLADVERGGSRG